MMELRRPGISRRAVGFGAIVGIFALALTIGCSRNAARRQVAPPVPIMTAPAVSMDVPIELRGIGTVEAYSSVSVTARVGGQLMRVGFSEGQDVAKGEMLFKIDPAPFQAALSQAQAALARDKAALDNAQADADRYKDLVGKEYVTRQEYETMVSTAAEAKATVEADEALVRTARLNLSYCTIVAPMAGRTGNINIKQGNQVLANSTTPLVTINQIIPLYVSFSVPGQRLSEVRRQSLMKKPAVWAYLAPDSATRYNGTLTFIDNAVDETTGMISLKATFPNADKALWPGQFVQVGLVLGVQRNAVVVPTSALQTSQQGEYLYVVMPGDTAQMRQVTTGSRFGTMAVIDNGVSAGEKVITDGQLRVAQGTRVAQRSSLTPQPSSGGGRK
jgi:membrane fusion protein, multidrug efflux system